MSLTTCSVCGREWHGHNTACDPWPKTEPTPDNIKMLQTHIDNLHEVHAAEIERAERRGAAKALAPIAEALAGEPWCICFVCTATKEALRRAEEPPLRCPQCSSLDVKRTDEEMVRCESCGYRTDLYEAMKQAEQEKP
jgi:hypothetical protein